MKSIFKSKCKNNNKILGRIIFLTIILIGLFTFFLFSKFNKNMNQNIKSISLAELNRINNTFITSKLTNNLINTESIQDILNINKNEKGEILFVDFNLDKAYKLLDNVSNYLTKSIQELESGSLDISYLDKDLTHQSGGLVLSIPLGSTLNSHYFYNWGPKIPVQINYVGTVLTNLETKITNYGLNNALVEMFIYVELSNKLITPFNVEDINLKYDAVIASLMIEGSVPEFYNGTIESSSNIHSQSIEK